MTQEISLKEMDEAVQLVKEKRDTYKAAKKISDEAHTQVQAAEHSLLLLMEKADRDSYITDNLRVSVTHSLSVQTPKTREDKVAFFRWLAEVKGQEIAEHYMTVNSVSLNSLYKELTEEAALRGEVLMPRGLGEPVTRTSISLRQV